MKQNTHMLSITYTNTNIVTAKIFILNIADNTNVQI